jgi:hypothetical protein
MLIARSAVQGHTLTLSRDRLDGAAGYRLMLRIIHGGLTSGRILAGSAGKISLSDTALTREPPLTPLAGRDHSTGQQLTTRVPKTR